MLFGKYVSRYYRKYLIFFIIGVVCLITVDWIQLYLPTYLGNLVDAFSDGTINQDILLYYVYRIIGIAFGMFIGRMGWRLSLFYASKKIESALREDMYKKALNLSVGYYHTTKVGSIMSWLTNDLETMEEFIGWGSLMMIDGVFLTLFALYDMFAADWALTLIAIIPIILIAVWGGVVEKIMDRRWKLRQESFDRLYDYSQENFTGIRVIKAFVKENEQIKMFSKISLLNKDMNVSFFKASILSDVVISILVNSIFSLIMGLGGFLVYASVKGTGASLFGETIVRTPGKIISYIGYFDTLVWPMIAIGQVITMYSKAHASYLRIASFLDQEEEIHNPEHPQDCSKIKGNVTFSHFSFSYPDEPEKPYLKDISLTIHEGELIGIIGRVGSGKSTLANSLLRLYNLNKGQVYVDDIDVMDADIPSLRTAVSYVPQDNFLFGDTIEENIGYGVNHYDRKMIEHAAEFADISGNISLFPEGYKTISGERGQTLSGGQKQRIAIARAYLKDSPIMILDDSVSAVDVKTEDTILEHIKAERKGKTTIIVASRISTIQNADRIIVLSNGELEAFASPEELERISPTYQRMKLLQQLEKGGDDHE